MRRLLVILPLLLTACSHADRSGIPPAPHPGYIASTNIETDASARAVRFCDYYHSAPPELAQHAGTISRFDCTGRTHGGDSIPVESLGGL